MITQVSSSLYQQLIATLEEGLVARGQVPALAGLRHAAFQRFKSVGFPTTRMEEWKYTNLQPLLNEHYALEDTLPTRNVALDKATIPDLEAYRIVLVNGIYRQDLSDQLQEQGVTVLPFQDAAAHELFLRHFAQFADKTDNPLVALNTALCLGGVFIALDKGVALSKPIHLVHVISSSTALFCQSRNLIVLGPNAQAQCIESFITDEGSAKSLSNNVSEIVVGENAQFQHYSLQTAAEQSNFLNHTEIHQAEHSLYNNYNCSFPGAGFVRNNINVRLDGNAVESHLYGIVLSAKNQLVDNHTVVDHRVPRCESYEWYKNIVQDESAAVFNGKIFVQLDAQKTNAFQQNNNMLIGDKATVYSKPQLEIFADDVKCSHGCTIGQFDEDALFYLRARGIGEQQARVLMVHAFAFDVTERFDNMAVRNYVDVLIEKGLQVN